MFKSVKPRRRTAPRTGIAAAVIGVPCFVVALIINAAYVGDGGRFEGSRPLGIVVSSLTVVGMLGIVGAVWGLLPNRAFSLGPDGIREAAQALTRTHQLVAELTEQMETEASRLEQVRRDYAAMSSVPEELRPMWRDQIERDRRRDRRVVWRELAFLVVGAVLGAALGVAAQAIILD